MRQNQNKKGDRERQSIMGTEKQGRHKGAEK